MTYIKNLLHKIEDLSIGYHLPKFHILCQNSYGIETIIKFFLETFFSLSDSRCKRCFNLSINRVASTLVFTISDTAKSFIEIGKENLENFQKVLQI